MSLRSRAAIACLVLPLAGAACSSSTKAPTGAATSGAASSGTSGTGGSGSSGSSSGGTGGMPASNEVTVVVTGASGAEMGRSIVFGDATGAVLGTVSTDASGTASMEVPGGSQVTAVLGTVTGPLLVTIASVEPGDVIHLVDPYALSTFVVAIDGILNYQGVPAGSEVALNGAPCARGLISTAPTASAPFTYVLPVGCFGPSGFPIPIAAISGGSEVAYSLSEGTSAGADAGPIDVTAGTGTWTTTFAHQTVTLSAPISGSGSAVTLTEAKDGIPYSQPSAALTYDGSSIASAGFPVHLAFPSTVEVEVAAHQTMVAFDVAGIATALAAPSGDSATTIDTTKLLPPITAATLDSSQPSQPSLSWTTTIGASAISGYVTRVSWQASSSGSTQYGTWVMVAPPSATRTQAPTLPASVASYAPPSSATYPMCVNVCSTGQGTSVFAVGGAAAASYASVRAKLALQFARVTYGNAPYGPTLAAGETFLYSAFFAAP